MQGEELNRNGELYIKRYPKLKLNLVDGSSLVVAVVLNNIPKGTTQVILRGNLSKVAYAIANTLCERDIKVRFNCRILALKKLGWTIGNPRLHLQCLHLYLISMFFSLKKERKEDEEHWNPFFKSNKPFQLRGKIRY